MNAYELVEKTGRVIRDDKSGAKSSNMPSLLKRFIIDAGNWLEQVKHFDWRYGRCAWKVRNMEAFAQRRGRRWPKGIRIARGCTASAIGKG